MVRLGDVSLQFSHLDDEDKRRGEKCLKITVEESGIHS